MTSLQGKTRNKTKKGFTLLELVVVISIIGIILGITFRLNLNRMSELTIKNEIANFEEMYNKHLATVLSTSIYEGSSYKEQVLEIDPEKNTISYIYSGSQTTAKSESFGFVGADIQQAFPLVDNKLIVTHKPYALDCMITHDVNTSTGNIVIGKTNEQAVTCFTISSSSCKLKKVDCQNLIQPTQ